MAMATLQPTTIPDNKCISSKMMEANSRLVASSHNRNELVLIRGHEESKPLKVLNGPVCEICRDEVGMMVDEDLFVACNECGFPVCMGLSQTLEKLA